MENKKCLKPPTRLKLLYYIFGGWNLSFFQKFSPKTGVQCDLNPVSFLQRLVGSKWGSPLMDCDHPQNIAQQNPHMIFNPQGFWTLAIEPLINFIYIYILYLSLPSPIPMIFTSHNHICIYIYGSFRSQGGPPNPPLFIFGLSIKTIHKLGIPH